MMLRKNHIVNEAYVKSNSYVEIYFIILKTKNSKEYLNNPFKQTSFSSFG